MQRPLSCLMLAADRQIVASRGHRIADWGKSRRSRSNLRAGGRSEQKWPLEWPRTVPFKDGRRVPTGAGLAAVWALKQTDHRIVSFSRRPTGAAGSICSRQIAARRYCKPRGPELASRRRQNNQQLAAQAAWPTWRRSLAPFRFRTRLMSPPAAASETGGRQLAQLGDTDRPPEGACKLSGSRCRRRSARSIPADRWPRDGIRGISGRRPIRAASCQLFRCHMSRRRPGHRCWRRQIISTFG